MPHSTLVTKLASPWVAAQTTSRTSPGPWGFLWITVSSRVPLLRTGRPRGSVWKTCLTSSWRSSSRTGPRPGLWIRARPWGPCCTTSTRRPDSHQGEISTIRRLWIISTLLYLQCLLCPVSRTAHFGEYHVSLRCLRCPRGCKGLFLAKQSNPTHAFSSSLSILPTPALPPQCLTSLFSSTPLRRMFQEAITFWGRQLNTLFLLAQ